MAAKLVHEEGTNTADSGRPPSPGHLSNSELVLGHNEPLHHYSDPGSLTQIIQHAHAQDTLPPSHNLRSGPGPRYRVLEHPAQIAFNKAYEAFYEERKQLKSLVFQKDSKTVELKAQLKEVVQEKTQLETKLTEVSKQLKDKSASYKKLEKDCHKLKEEKEDFRRRLTSAEEDKAKLEEDAMKLKAENNEKIADLQEKLKSAENESQTIILSLTKEKHGLELQVAIMKTKEMALCCDIETAKRERAEFETELVKKESELKSLKDELKVKQL